MESRGLTRSMSKKGCSPDNSACEGFFGRIKNEVFHKRDRKGWTLDDFMYFIDRYLNWFRNERIKISSNNKNPMEYRTDLGLALLFITRKRPHSHKSQLKRDIKPY